MRTNFAIRFLQLAQRHAFVFEAAPTSGSPRNAHTSDNQTMPREYL